MTGHGQDSAADGRAGRRRLAWVPALLLVAALAAVALPSAAAHNGTAAVACPGLFLGLVPLGAHLVLHPPNLFTSSPVFHLDVITRSPFGGCISVGVQSPV